MAKCIGCDETINLRIILSVILCIRAYYLEMVQSVVGISVTYCVLLWMCHILTISVCIIRKVLTFVGISGTSPEGVPAEAEWDSHTHPVLREGHAAHGDAETVQ